MGVKMKNTDSTQATVGAIRWDAWFGTDFPENNVSAQTTRSLSPPAHHFRLPFFAEITADNTCYFPAYTQDIMDAEINLAANAGIDYWAYVWYVGHPDALAKARKLHITSQYRQRVKICSIFEKSAALCHPEVREEVKSLMEAGLWMTVLEDRPLMFYFDASPEVAEDIAYYRDMCKLINLPPPYAVVMNGSTKETLAELGADAASDYAFWANDGVPFKDLTAIAEKRWRDFIGQGQIVPCVTTGWDNRPRIENPVSWITYLKGNEWVQTATAEEIGEHLTRALVWVAANKACAKANTVLMYAWNENDEGGWLTPTLMVDVSGRLLYDANGNKQIDYSRLEVVKRVIG